MRMVVLPEDVDKEALHEVCSNNFDFCLLGYASTGNVCTALIFLRMVTHADNVEFART